MGFLSLSLLIAIIGCIALGSDATTCKREYKKTGCFKRNEKIFKHMLITDLDPTHHKWGQDIDWGDYHGSLHSLACRCRTKAVTAGYKWFSLGFYGECWGASEEKFEVDHMNVGMCVNGDTLPCNHEKDKECSGVQDNEYVYEVTTAVPGKNLVGYWDVAWSAGEPVKYSIEIIDNNVIMRIVSCSWASGTTTCNTAKTAPIKVSTSAKYPAKDGWLQVQDLHYGKLHIYIKEKDGKIVDMIWLRPSGYKETAKITQGVAPGPPPELTSTSTCSFVIGDGVGGTEVKIGDQTENACVNACIQRKQKDPRINGVTIYKTGGVGGCWCEMNMKRVAKDVRSTKLYKTCFISPVYVDLAPKQVALVRNNLAYTLPVLKKQYDISFEVYPTKWNRGQWGSILHLTTSDNIDKYGARIPGVWFSPHVVNNQNSICPATALSGNLNYHFYSPRVDVNKWTRMRLTQQMVNGKYMYRVFLNGAQIHEKENTKPEDFYNVKVYLGDPWYLVQPGYIRNVNIRNIREQTVDSTELFQQKTVIAKNQEPYVVPVLRKQFDISFEVLPTSFPKTRWGTNVLHMTTSGNYGHGMRIPAVWFLPNPTGNTNTIYIVFEVNGNVNYFPTPPRVKVNEWTTIRVTQQLEGSKYMYRIFLNGKMLHEIENKKPQDFHHVKVLAADNWHDTQPGYIRHLRIHNLGLASESSLKLVRARSRSAYHTYNQGGNHYTWGPNNVIDGDMWTFMATTTNNGWWEAELEEPAVVSGVQLGLGRYAFHKGYYKGIKLQVRRYPADPWSDCTTGLKITGPKGAERAFLQEVKCIQKTPVKYIRIVVDGTLYLAEVTVHGTEVQEPVLPLMNAKADSTYGDLKRWVPNNAIDGNLETFSVTKTVRTAWWEAELKQAAVIANFELYLGSYAYGRGYYNGMRVQVRMKSTDPWSNCISGIKIAGPIGSERSFPQEVYCNRPVPSKYIRITISLNQPLYLSEVIVHGKA